MNLNTISLPWYARPRKCKPMFKVADNVHLILYNAMEKAKVWWTFSKCGSET
jgi:hypothetical protein